MYNINYGTTFSAIYIQNFWETANIDSTIILKNNSFINTQSEVPSEMIYLQQSSPNFAIKSSKLTIENLFINKTQGFNTVSGFFADILENCSLINASFYQVNYVQLNKSLDLSEPPTRE